MTKLKALKAYPFDNKDRHVGDVFDASDDDANTLVLTGLAEYVDQPGGHQTRAMKAQSDDAPSPSPPPPPTTAHRKGRYPRRDMRADD